MRMSEIRGARFISIHAPREGGDPSTVSSVMDATNFNPRPPRGGRPAPGGVYQSLNLFQSTPPARGATARAATRSFWTSTFQSTPPARGATLAVNVGMMCTVNFNPRPPRGGRLIALRAYTVLRAFQSTPPARGATSAVTTPSRLTLFQSTPPARGATTSTYGTSAGRSNFNPRPPRGGRQQRCTVLPADL